MPQNEKNAKPIGGPGGRGGHGPRPNVKNPGKLFMRLLSYIMKNYAVHCVIVVICIFITVLASVQGTWFMQTLIDGYILPLMKQSDPDFSGLAHAILRVAVFYGIGAIAAYIYTRIMVNVSQGTLKHLRDDMFTHMEELPIRYFDTHSHGDIMSTYTNDIDTLRQMISQSMPQFLNSIISIVSVFISMLLLNIPLTLVTLVMVGVTLFATKKIGALSARYFIAQQKDIATVNGYIEEMMNGQKVVKVFNHEQTNLEGFQALNARLQSAGTSAQGYSATMIPAVVSISYINYAVIAVLGGLMVMNGQSSLGSLASYLVFVRQSALPINQFTQQGNFLLAALAGAERIFNVLDEQPETDAGTVEIVRVEKSADGTLVPSAGGRRTGLWAWRDSADPADPLVPLRGDVRFRDVSFGYISGQTTLHDVTLYAKPGQKIAFVGSTGAGKTTITNLINRFYDITSGTITYDGIDVRKIRKSDLRRSLGVVLQDTHLFTGTVADNIRFGKLDATDEEIIAAAKIANAHSFIERLPQGYNTMVSGDGANLSQGQRQLLAIARAAVADPPVLILDEATSSIDTRTEALIEKGMDRLMEGRTVFVIAHRLSTVRNSNAIIVLEHGGIVERGSHDELLAQKGEYYQLYNGMFELA